MESFSKKRPTFDQFKVWFMDEVNRYSKNNIDNSYMSWSDVGNDEIRAEIIESFMKVLEKSFGFRPLIEDPLSTMDGSVESVVIRIYHVFSTMFLVEHINEKMYGERAKRLN
ncbi:hypothetical protein [Desulfoscipio gibsoniae]|uniref:Uncharacterized protein n=1 Tax=Desulfoscipio gibsoniae DSM 7213 TaxID=767817 RepID=R4KFH4_9FIRM|nr:hypothetical protein [Desulfoscipio gibsoniae]AGL01928.1 hypothetical protein Desgi_2522 [Desulfoscipio gibsoniae DSM 7213]